MHSNRKITFNNTMFGKIIQLNHAFPAGTEGETCYSTDRLETRGVFRGFFAKNPSFTAKKPEFYGENPIAKRFGMGFSQATVHALDRACTVAETWKARPVCQESPPEK